MQEILEALQTWEKWTEPPTSRWSTASVLCNAGLHKEDRDANNRHEDQIRNKKSTATITIAKVRETPQIT